MIDNRSLRKVIDSISEAAKADGVPHEVAGKLLFNVMRLREINCLLANGLPDNYILKNPLQPQQ